MFQLFAKFALKSVEFKEEEKAEEEQDGVSDRECDNEETDEEEIPEGDDGDAEFDVQNIMIKSDDEDDVEEANVSPQPELPLISSESESSS